MKAKILIITLCISTFLNAQVSDVKDVSDVWNFHLSTDSKILILGSDNEYTSHPGVGNFLAQVEYIDDYYEGWQSVFYVGFEYANLSRYYKSAFIGYGTKIYLTKKLYVIPSIETQFIWRERIPVNENDNRSNAPYWSYVGTTIDLRYQFTKKLSFTLRFNAELATDLPNRLIRWQTTQGLVYSM